jgi:hypothetical protein
LETPSIRSMIRGLAVKVSKETCSDRFEREVLTIAPLKHQLLSPVGLGFSALAPGDILVTPLRAVPRVETARHNQRMELIWGSLETSHPPPSALIKRTLASMRRRRISTSFRSFCSATVSAETT